MTCAGAGQGTFRESKAIVGGIHLCAKASDHLPDWEIVRWRWVDGRKDGRG